LPSLLATPAGAVELPANYVKFARKLLSALRDSIEADLSPANEAEVRRKADPAKMLVKEWVANWRDVRAVSGEVSFKQIKESLQILGDFYLKKGQRTRLPPELGSELLRRLDAASAALPPSA